jgi:hypothetical protein
MSATVQITEEEGAYVAVDLESGERGRGETRALALVALAASLQGLEDPDQEALDSEAALRRLSADVRERFDDAGVTQDDLEDAIAWARSG